MIWLLRVISVYKCADNRVRAYCRDENNKAKVVSYPRILMEESLGRPLEPYEDVHHIDGNKLNNDLSNLEVINHGTHQRLHNKPKYHDKVAICEVCGNQFIWTTARQALYYSDLNRGLHRIISCSNSCSSYYGRQKQLGRDT